MRLTSILSTALATVCLLAFATPSTPSASANQPTAEEPLNCPYCGGLFSYESFLAETGIRVTLRAVRAYTGG